MASEYTIAAIVVTYNRRVMLEQCLRALLAQSRQIDRIIVVDNASTDSTPSLFCKGADFCTESIQYCRLNQNVGGAGGFKEGMRIAVDAGFDWCWIMDDDVIPEASALAALVASETYLMDKGVRPSFLASYVAGANGEVMNVPNVSKHVGKNGYRDWCEHLPQGLVRIVSATFVSLLISSKAVAEVGLPIADYFLWGDDIEYTNRLTSYYGPAFVCGQSKVVHMRSDAKPISTLEENNPTRVANRRRATRNDLITTSYYAGKAKAARRVLHRMRECTQIVLKAPNLKAQKINSVCGGVLDFLTHQYDMEDLAKLNKSDMKRY